MNYMKIASDNKRLPNENNDLNLTEDIEMNGDDYEDDIRLYDLKKKLESGLKNEIIEENSCRACATEDGVVNLFESVDDSGFDLASKMKLIGGVEVTNFQYTNV